MVHEEFLTNRERILSCFSSINIYIQNVLIVGYNKHPLISYKQMINFLQKSSILGSIEFQLSLSKRWIGTKEIIFIKIVNLIESF